MKLKDQYVSEYGIWKNARQRCRENPDYAGRGISFSEDWNTFEKFFEDMGPRPENYSIDRIDNDGNYCKENCKWVDRDTQNRNKRSNRYLTHDGITMVAKDWARHFDVDYNALLRRLKEKNQDVYTAAMEIKKGKGKHERTNRYKRDMALKKLKLP